MAKHDAARRAVDTSSLAAPAVSPAVVSADVEPARGRVADENDLCRLWAARAFAADNLVTADGRKLQVIYPGRRTGAGGPDFRDAMLADGEGRVYAGDVEVHLRSRDWLAHGHRADPAYNNVVLHVVLEDDGAPCLRSDGAPVAVLALGPILTAPLAPSPELPVAQPCRVAPELTTDEVRAIVQRAGRARLDGKAAALEAQIELLGPEPALFTALLDSAGYSRNRAPCLALAERVPIERLHDLLAGKDAARATRIAMAVLLGLAGLLPRDDEELTSCWDGYGDLWPLPPLRPDDWVRAGVRPANRPEWRLRGVAILAARSTRTGLVGMLLPPLRSGDAAGLVALLEVPAAAISSASMRVDTRDGEAIIDTITRRTPPIGRSRAVEMAVNAVVPFALALSRSAGDRGLEDGAWRTVEALPTGEDSEPQRAMLALLKNAGHRLRAPGALMGQGLLHLHRTHCGVHACWDCPLATGTILECGR